MLADEHAKFIVIMWHLFFFFFFFIEDVMDVLLQKTVDDRHLAYAKVQIMLLVQLEIRLSLYYAGMLSSMARSFCYVSLVSC